MASRLTYIQNHDGNRKWIIERFSDEDHASKDYIYICQRSDGNVVELDIVKIPRDQWEHLVASVNEAMGEFK